MKIYTGSALLIISHHLLFSKQFQGAEEIPCDLSDQVMYDSSNLSGE